MTAQTLSVIEFPKLLHVIGDTVALRILFDIEAGSHRFCELRGTSSTKTLSSRLRTLTDQGLVARSVHPSVPPKVEYALTQKGSEFLSIVRGIGAWERRT